MVLLSLGYGFPSRPAGPISASMTARLWDITQPLRPGMPTWPGDTPFDSGNVWSMGPGAPVNVGRFSQSVHAGTHGDAPFHYDAGGVTERDVKLAEAINRLAGVE